MPRLAAVALLTAALASAAVAQMVDCSITVNYESVATTHKELLNTFASDINEYVNRHNWGGGNAEERISCTMNIFISSAIGDNRYSAQVFIGSQRPIFDSEQSTAVVRLFDETWEFTYIKNRPIDHNVYSFSDLASFLDFYMFLVMGYDFDTYELLGGTPFFQKAADIASLGRSSGQRGWQATTGTYSRVQLVEELLNPKFEPLRAASWRYHFAGLDSLSAGRSSAYENVLGALKTIGELRTRIDPRNLSVRVFFEAKYLEVASLFQDYPDREVYVTLTRIDPAHQKTYEEYRSARH
jgi:hypothetical protein